MTRAQFLALLAAAGVGGIGSGAILYTPGPPPSAVWPHALRVESSPDLPERIEAYLTRATAEADGGVDLEDLGPQVCADGGSVAELLTWVAARCPLDDGVTVTGAYVTEARPVPLPDGGGEVALEIYGINGVARCTSAKLLAFRRFVGALDCQVVRRRAGTSPL